MRLSYIALCHIGPELGTASTVHNALFSRVISETEESRRPASPPVFNDDLGDGGRIRHARRTATSREALWLVLQTATFSSPTPTVV